MRVIFKKTYKDARGRIYIKGAEEGLTREVAIPLIAKHYYAEVVEFRETGILDKDGKQILKQK